MRSLWLGVLVCAAMLVACGDDSSSNSVETVGCRTETEDSCEYGELMDERDGQTYRTVKIGDQVWTAQNLNYETENSWCGGVKISLPYGLAPARHNRMENAVHGCRW